MLETLLDGRFKILRVLGSGGFGQTFVAEDQQQDDRPECVVKQFRPSRQDEAYLQTARRLFASEVATLRKLGSHDRIPALLAEFEQNQEFYFVQEYVEGRTLEQELAIGHLNEAAVWDLLRQVLQTLAFVHRHQVIHRDIKPANLIRRQHDSQFVLIDFGAVKELQTQLTTDLDQTTNLTVAIGTQGYAPSEQLMGKPRYNSDLYALGMTAIQALTGISPSHLPTDMTTAEVVWHDRAEVSPHLAAVLDRMVRYHFSQRFQSVEEVLQALDQPSLLTESEQTALSELTQARVAESLPALPTIAKLPAKQRMSLATTVIGIASVAVTGLLLGSRQLGWLQPLELMMFDRLMQINVQREPDPRLLVVGITEADIQAQQRFPLSDRTIAQGLKKLKSYQPRTIGLDLLRDIPQEPGRSELLAELNAPNVIAITNLGGDGQPVTPAPPQVPSDRVGFNDLVLDPDGVVRRNLLFADGEQTTVYSFSLRLAISYLKPQGMSLQTSYRDPDVFRLGQSTFQPLEPNSGGYGAIDARGYQVLLRYRSPTVARQVSLTEVLKNQVKPEWVRDKIVLIGTTAANQKDLFFTPYSAIEPETPRLAGVVVHAHAVSQLLDAALEGRSLFWFWSESQEMLWLVAWAIAGGTVAWFIRHPIVLGLSGAGLLLLLMATGMGAFRTQGWIPIVAPALAATMTGGVIVAYRAYWV